jgi:hypothetical protein
MILLFGGRTMNKKIIGIFICMLFISTTIPITGIVLAGDEQNPEITDDENDMFKHPYFYVPEKSLKAIDILSAWFYENQNESDYLLIAVKVVDLNYLLFYRSTYAVEWWGQDDYVYTASLATQFRGLFSLAVVLRSYPNKVNLISTSFDKENNIVIFKIPKNLIGDPKPGDILKRTRASTGITFFGYYLDLYLALDTAPNFQSSGKNYIIQY